MNIYLFELKSQWKDSLIWTFSVILFLAVFQLGIYPAFADSLDEVMEVINGFPKPFLAAFGFDSDTMFSFGGFFSLTYGYLTLIGAIMAAALSVTAFAREKHSKCSDFLLSKPCRRREIFLAKLAEILTLMIASNLLVLTAAVLIYRRSGEPDKDMGAFLLCITGLFFTEIVFAAIGTAFAVFARKVRSISGVATAVGFSAFILSALYAILDEKALRFLAPLKYFNPEAVYSDGGFEFQYVCTAAIIILVCIGTAYLTYCRRDTHSV